MEILFPLLAGLALLLFLLVIVTIIGHGIWVALAWLFREAAPRSSSGPPSILPTSSAVQRGCINCGYALVVQMKFCGVCGAQRLSLKAEELLRELDTTMRQLERLHQAGALDEINFRVLRKKIETEREQILFPHGRPGTAKQRSLFTPETAKPAAERPKPAPERAAEPQPFITPAILSESAAESAAPEYGAWAKDSDKPKPPEPVVKPPRRPFSEMLEAFMEQSNVRWGEIIGGLLIIGCSTALVISLWAQISRVPLMKFLIFTTVTAALFAVGFYTEHHWKLPTTSRGILTIATLLVPLNFLAIAAVSAGTYPPDTLILVSELIAPALFLCLVYYAGRVITPKWPHLLAAGALGSSAGQLLIRHFADPETLPGLMIALGAVPVLFYVGATGWSLKRALADGEIDESETNALFVTLGSLTFAAVLPFGLLLYKSGSTKMSMMYLAPLVTLAGAPMLGTGVLLWRQVQKNLAATRTAAGSIAILGMFVALAGMVLGWPNPSSIVPAAVFNFLLFTAVAVFLEESRAHIVAAACITFAYLTAFQVIAGHIPWKNPALLSLVQAMAGPNSGQALAFAFVAFLVAYEALNRKGRRRDAFSYLISACGVALLSLLFLFAFAIRLDGDPFYVSAILAFYSAGAFWLAWREKKLLFSWAGSILLFLTSAQACHSLLSLTFPWQAACLLFSAACVTAALAVRQFSQDEKASILITPLKYSAIAATAVASILMAGEIIWRGFEPASLLATHALLLAAVSLGLFALDRSRIFATYFQMALTLAAILFTKSFLQRFDWYGYLPHAWLHPWALQVQGSVLALICLASVGVRMFARGRAARADDSEGPTLARAILEIRTAFDHVLALALVGGFAAFTVLGAASGISKELASPSRSPLVYDLGFPHELIFGIGSLILFAILVALMFGNLRERRQGVFALGMLVVLWTLCPLVAGRFESQTATASAGRWAAAIFLLALAIIHAFRKRSLPVESRRDFEAARLLVIVLTLGPLLFLTLSPVIDDVNYVPGRGPQAGIFRAMGGVVLYGVPLILATAALVIHAVVERSTFFAFAAGLLVNVGVTSVLIVSVAEMNGAMNRVLLVNALQLNAIAAASVLLVWIATRFWWMGRTAEGEGLPAGSERFLLTAQKAIASGLTVLFIAPVALRLIAMPARAGIGTLAAGNLNGWLAVLLTIAAVIAFNKLFQKPIEVALVALSLLAFAALAAFGAPVFAAKDWAGLHVLLAAMVVIGWLLLFLYDLPKIFNSSAGVIAGFRSRTGLAIAEDWRSDILIFASAVGAGVVLVALRGPFSDPLGAWWSIGAVLAMCALASALNWVTFHRAYLYVAGILFNVSASIWLIKYERQHVAGLSAFVEANVIALCAGGLAWLLLELRARRAQPSTAGTTASFHNVAAIASLLAVSMILAVRLHDDFFGLSQMLFPALDSLVLAALVVFMAACLWDRDASYAVAGIYVIALLASGMALHNLSLPPKRLAWGLMMAAAILTLVAALLWRARQLLIAWSHRLRIPSRIDPAASEIAWLNIFNSILAIAVIGLAFWSDLTFSEWRMRGVAAIAVMAQALTFGLMAQGPVRARWQQAAVLFFLIGAVFFGWSWLVPGTSGTWLNRAVILMSLMFVTVGLFGIGLGKFFEREPDWSKAVRACVPVMTLVGILSLAFVLTTEIYSQIEFGAVRVSFPALAAVAVTLAAGVVICILFAVSPKHDPLGFSERWRTAYVYVAEAMTVLLFMHIRLTMPWLFHGFFQRYWPLVVLAIAYAGVTTSEILRRRQIRVLAEPIQHTGAFLPLLPVIGFWIAQSQVEYSTLLFVVGGVYGLLSILRRSFFFGLAAALAGNGGLWYMLQETSDYHFFQHPQLWLIPAAVSVLIAAHLNRKNFSEAQMTGVRYLCLIAIYVSSTADIFLNGVAQSPWLPLVLAALSLAGVFAGMMFRVRAFLILGSIFLLLAIATIINYASVNLHWTWLWYVAGIVTGAMIITTFAVFEKKRADVLRVVDGLKDWKG